MKDLIYLIQLQERETSIGYYRNLNKHSKWSKCDIGLTRDNCKEGRTVCKSGYRNHVHAYYKNEVAVIAVEQGDNTLSKTIASSKTKASSETNASTTLLNRFYELYTTHKYKDAVAQSVCEKCIIITKELLPAKALTRCEFCKLTLKCHNSKQCDIE